MKWKPKIIDLVVTSIASYLIGLILDQVLFIGLREKIRFSSSSLYIDRPGSFGKLSIYYIILAIIVSVLFLLFAHWIRNRRSWLKRVLVGVVGVCVLVFTFYGFLSWVIPIARVDNKTEISGSIKDTRSYVYLFVRPLSLGTGQIWLQGPVPLQPDSFGEWRATAWFGGIAGTRYEIFGIFSSSKIERFSHPGVYDFKDIPHKVERFVRVVEHR